MRNRLVVSVVPLGDTSWSTQFLSFWWMAWRWWTTARRREQ